MWTCFYYTYSSNPCDTCDFWNSAAKEYESLLLKLNKGKLFHDFFFAALLMQIKVNLFHQKYMMKFLWVLMWLYFFIDKINHFPKDAKL